MNDVLCFQNQCVKVPVEDSHPRCAESESTNESVESILTFSRRSESQLPYSHGTDSPPPMKHPSTPTQVPALETSNIARRYSAVSFSRALMRNRIAVSTSVSSRLRWPGNMHQTQGHANQSARAKTDIAQLKPCSWMHAVNLNSDFLLRLLDKRF